jgi:hypothetical protein
MHVNTVSRSLLFLLFLCLSNLFAQLAGEYNIDQNASGAQLYPTGNYFSSFGSAIDVLEIEGVSAMVTFNVSAGQTFIENIQIDSTFNGVSAINQIIFKGDSDNKPVVKPATYSTGTDGLGGVIDIRFNGDHYLTFENIKVNATNDTLTFKRGIRIMWGADRVTIRNCEVYDFSQDGIVIYWGDGPSGDVGQNNLLEQNKVYHMNLSSTTVSSVHGILEDGGDGNIIRNNFVYDLIPGTSVTSGMTGIRSRSDPAVISNTCDIYNNFVSLGANISDDIRIYGIYSLHDNLENINISHNSVYISGSVSTSSIYTSAFRLLETNTTNQPVFKNNIAYNARTKSAGSGEHYAIFIQNTSSQYAGDYNDLYVAQGYLGYLTGPRLNLSEWQSASQQDSNSISADPLFLSPTDLHVLSTSPVSNAGTHVSEVTTDIDGEIRDLLNPDIGADEFLDTPINEPPIANDDSARTREDIAVIIDVLANDMDPDGNLVPWSVTVINEPTHGNTSVNTSNGEITYTPETNYYGSDSFTYQVDDNNSESSNEANVSITISSVNDTPIVTESIPDKQATEDIFFTFTFSENVFSDVDVGDNLTYSSRLSNGNDLPSWLSFNSSTRTFSGTPVNEDVGIISIRVTATDDSSASSFTDFDLEVVNVNDAPQITGQENLSTPEETSLTITLNDLHVTDPDNFYPDDFTLSVQSGTNYNRNGNTITPVTDFIGMLTVPVRVNDGAANSNLYNLAVSVTAVNDVPLITGQEALNTAEETSLTITLNDLHVTDPDNIYPDDFTLGVQNGTNYNRSGNTITPLADFNGALTVHVRVNDGADDSDLYDLTVNVSAINDPPLITGQENLGTPEETSLTITLDDLHVIDPDNNYPDDFTLSIQDGTNYNRSENTITPIPDFIGTLTVPVRVNDGTDNSNLFDMTVDVTNVNDAPVVANPISDQQTTEDSLYTFTFAIDVFNDVDEDDNLSYDARLSDGSNLPAWLAFEASTRSFSGTPTNEDVGNLNIRVTATDEASVSVYDEFILEVLNINDAPYISMDIPVSVFDEDDSLSFSVKNWYAYVEDPDHPDSTLLFYIQDGSFVISEIDSTVIKFQALANWNGSDTLRVTVTDGELSDTTTIVVQVHAVNDAPFFKNFPDTVTVVNTAEKELYMGDYIEDIDTPIENISWQFTISDTALKLDFNEETARLTMIAPDFMGIITLYCTVIDDSLASGMDSLYVKVVADPTAINDFGQEIPSSYVLKQNYPNPFNPLTNIKFGLPRAGKVSIDIYNILGQKVATVFTGFKAPGYHTITFNAGHLPSGIYFYRIFCEDFADVKKMMLVK